MSAPSIPTPASILLPALLAGLLLAAAVACLWLPAPPGAVTAGYGGVLLLATLGVVWSACRRRWYAAVFLGVVIPTTLLLAANAPATRAVAMRYQLHAAAARLDAARPGAATQAQSFLAAHRDADWRTLENDARAHGFDELARTDTLAGADAARRAAAFRAVLPLPEAAKRHVADGWLSQNDLFEMRRRLFAILQSPTATPEAIAAAERAMAAISPTPARRP